MPNVTFSMLQLLVLTAQCAAVLAAWAGYSLQAALAVLSVCGLSWLGLAQDRNHPRIQSLAWLSLALGLICFVSWLFLGVGPYLSNHSWPAEVRRLVDQLQGQKVRVFGLGNSEFVCHMQIDAEAIHQFETLSPLPQNRFLWHKLPTTWRPADQSAFDFYQDSRHENATLALNPRTRQLYYWHHARY